MEKRSSHGYVLKAQLAELAGRADVDVNERGGVENESWGVGSDSVVELVLEW